MNVVVDQNAAGNIKPAKARSPEKIDGIVAMIIALDRCIRHEQYDPAWIVDHMSKIKASISADLIDQKYQAGVAAPASLLAQRARGCNEIYHL